MPENVYRASLMEVCRRNMLQTPVSLSRTPVRTGASRIH